MMKNSAPAPSASGFHPAERLPLFWLAAACVLGLSWSLAYAFGFLFGEPLPWPAGRLMFAFYGILVYGWALPVLFSRMNGTKGKWTRLAGVVLARLSGPGFGVHCGPETAAGCC